MKTFRVGCGRALLDGWRLLLINNAHHVHSLTSRINYVPRGIFWRDRSSVCVRVCVCWSSYVTPRTSSGRPSLVPPFSSQSDCCFRSLFTLSRILIILVTYYYWDIDFILFKVAWKIVMDPPTDISIERV